MANREKASTRKKSGSAKQGSPARRSGPVKKSAAARLGGPVKKGSAARTKRPAKQSGAARATRPVKKSTAARKMAAAKKGTAARKMTAVKKGTAARKTTAVKKGTAARRSSPTAAARRRQAARPSAARRAGPAADSAKKSLVREIQDAVDRGREWLSERGDYYAFLSRSGTLRGAPELGRHLRGDLLAKQDREGSWGGGDLTATTEAIWQLLDMGTSPEFRPLSRALDWLYGRLDAEGSFASGCTPVRHEQEVCEHFLKGFFSPAKPNQTTQITLTNGQNVTADAAARLLASERALRSALRANPRDPRTAVPLDGLTSLPLYEQYGGAFPLPVLVGAVQALAWSPGPGVGSRQAGLATLAAAQEPDGSWPDVELFFVLETLLETRHPLTDGMLKRTVPQLLESRHREGTWGRHYVAAQTWIAVRVLERMAAHDPRGRFGSY